MRMAGAVSTRKNYPFNVDQPNSNVFPLNVARGYSKSWYLLNEWY